jgi:hypothetical protein
MQFNAMIKFAILLVYHAVLHQAGLLTNEFKLHTFLIVTPFAKFYRYQQKGYPLAQWALSLIYDSAWAYFAMKVVPVYCTGLRFIYLVFVLLFVGIGFERLNYVFWPVGTYVIKMPKHWYDNTLSLFVVGQFLYVGSLYDFNLSMSPMTLLMLYAFAYTVDFTFGTFHILSHRIPAMYKRHLVHHEYKKDDLVAIANTYGELSDNIGMTLPSLIAYSVPWILGHAHPAVVVDAIYAAFLTHNKYRDGVMHLLFFFEYDVLDIFFDKANCRMAEYHAEHHNVLTERFSLFGFLPDRLFEVVCSPILSRWGSSRQKGASAKP